MTTLQAFLIVWIALGLLNAVTFAALSLMASVAGWAITVHLQRELLKQQQDSSGRITRLPLRPGRRADQLGKVAAWVSESEKIRRLALGLQYLPSTRDELVAKFQDWETAYFAQVLPTAELLDVDLANLLRKYYGFLDLFTVYSISGQVNNQVNPLWNAEMTGAKDALAAKLSELSNAAVGQ